VGHDLLEILGFLGEGFGQNYGIGGANEFFEFAAKHDKFGYIILYNGII
jgi:hypothetical protein